MLSFGEQDEGGGQSSPTSDEGEYLLGMNEFDEPIDPSFNPPLLDDEDEQMLEITDSCKIKVRRDPEAAYTFGFCRTLWERMRAAEDPNDPFFPFHSAEEFEIVQYLATAKLSQASIDQFLQLSFVRQHES